jgi:NhaC family Na+:H+ antiporter
MSETKRKKQAPRAPSWSDALIPVIFLLTGIIAGLYLYGGDSIGGPIQVALLLSAMVAGLIGYKNGHSVEKIGKAATDSIATAVGAIFILLSVGALIGTWNMSGTIVTLTQWGIQILSPNWFYVATVVICAAIALGIGSSWTVIGTIGVALIGIASALGVSPEITAGAAISGAYFGDKLSPLSETTNLAAAVAGTDLYTHIRGMMATTIPSIIIALGLYTIIGLRTDVTGAFESEETINTLESFFYTGIVTMIPLIAVIYLAVRKVPPSLAIMTGALLGGLIAVIFQPDIVRAFVDDADLNTFWTMVKGVWDAMATGFVASTGVEGLDSLIDGGGMSSMLDTIWLIISALAFGGIMDYTGCLGKLISPMVERSKTDRAIVASTGATAIGVNVIAADQYLAIVLTGNTYKAEYEKRGIAPQTLSREIEDTATVTSPLIPWNSCGAYMSGALGIATFAYFPYTFFNLINPVLSFIYAGLGFQIKKVPPKTEFKKTPEEAVYYGIGGQDAEELPFIGDESSAKPPDRKPTADEG